MLNRVNGKNEFFSGFIFAALGAVLFVWSFQYRMGTVSDMGPGFFPAILGGLLMLLGLAAVVRGAVTKIPDPLRNHKVVPLLFMVVSVVSFGLLIERAGLVVASFVCLAFACYQRVLTKPLEVLCLFVVITLFNYVVFIYIFGMAMPVFWWN